ncbi:MAG: GNAT family N-acetyltransferase [Anaerolineae bacterium]|nr:GNAT family N-acetyltransferase [Anaerolineae bacterium]
MAGITLRTLQPGDEAALEAFLRPRIESSMFLLSNMRIAGLAYTGQRPSGTYVAAFEDGAMVAVAAHFWNGMLMPQAPVHLEAVWKATVQASGRPIRGLIGSYEQVVAIKTALKLEGDAMQMDNHERLYTLSLDALQVPEALRTGQVKGRRVAPRDAEILARWRVGYEVEALGATETPELWERERADARRTAKSGNAWILEAGGQPVATSNFNAAIAEAVQIGGVWTPPELRRRGYARCVVAQSLLDARSSGVPRAILFTDEHNLPAQKAYTSLGFRHVGEFYLLMLKKGLDPQPYLS